jgi:hypothetical protein
MVHLSYLSITNYTTHICPLHAIPLASVCHMLYHFTYVCHMLYHFHLSAICYATPICLSPLIPLPTVCHMLYHFYLTVTYFITTKCPSLDMPFPSICHMLYTPICYVLYYFYLSDTFYTTPIYVTCYATSISLSHTIPLPSLSHML